MSLFARRKDKQIPKTPVSQDKSVQNWMDSVGGLINKYFFGGGNDRIVTAQELIDGGIAGTGSGGFLTSPPKNLTKPPKVSGLTANGAFAAIYVQWNNPSFSNYSHTELWRADIDDIGQAMLIASTAVESYTDNVGSAATKYYWARAVSSAGVKGDFNAASGVKGTTSLDPEYAKQILTSITWKPNTTYYPFQYVRPTVENGFQYAAVDGGRSGNIEPTWPLSVDPTIVTNDGTVQWKCLHIEDRIPFVLGALEDGTPAVFMDTAYIKNASITSAKIGDLVADKITTGDLNADLHVLSKLWYGFNLPNGDFLDPEDNTVTSGKTGFYLGVNGSNPAIPIFHLNTGVANGSKSLYFDGDQLKITGDGIFDDIFVDNASFNTVSTNVISYGARVIPSEYTLETNISLNNSDYNKLLCYVKEINRSKKVVGDAYQLYINLSGGQVYFVNESYLFSKTIKNDLILPYNKKDINRFDRFKSKSIEFSMLVKGFVFESYLYSIFSIQFSPTGSSSYPIGFNLIPHMPLLSSGQTVILSDGGLTITLRSDANGLHIKGNDTNNVLNYKYMSSIYNGYVSCTFFVLMIPTGGSYIVSGLMTPEVTLQLNKPEYDAEISINTEQKLPF